MEDEVRFNSQYFDNPFPYLGILLTLFKKSCSSTAHVLILLYVYLVNPPNVSFSEQNLLLSRSRLCHYSVGGAWWHLCFYESFSTLCG
jgi:hypothetical protein